MDKQATHHGTWYHVAAVVYGDKYFCENDFQFDLACALNNIKSVDTTYETFQSIYIRTLDIHVPFKIKYVRGNDQQFMNKDMCKAIMNRTKLKNMYYKHPTEENMRKFKKTKEFLCKTSS